MSRVQRLPHTAAALRLVRGAWDRLTGRRPLLGAFLVIVAYAVCIWAALAVGYLVKEAFR